MDFYRSIADYYEIIFPTNPQQIRFVSQQVVAESRILDVACGTGALARGLAKVGYQVVGYDLDNGMITKAQELANAEKLDITYAIWDMRELPDPPQGFDALLCVGNSLVHLLNTEEISSTLVGFSQQLLESGRLIIQIINYDRILDAKINALPTIKDDQHGLVFERLYDLREDGLIDFRTGLRVVTPEYKDVIRNTVPLLPLRKEQLVELLQRAGFMVDKVYGGFDTSPWEPNSYATVVVAVKKSI